MSQVFNACSTYYDLLYKDKDYAGEAQYVLRLIQAHAPAAKTIFKLGCGTGMHAVLLDREEYSICGIDRSHKFYRCEWSNYQSM